ncbi:hypothetical protein ACPPVT_02050 [Angustibacter sp. McL0619]|uniref:hypothetical protein n=1 Tax=Angustibacter sp. McL0619 TaxID=3415676 RepID=UPI003CEA83C8
MLSKSAVVLVAVTVTATAAGCTSSGSKPSPSAASSGSKTSATHLPTQKPLPAPSKIRNDVELRRTTEITSCTSKSGGWQASGKSVNPSKKDVHLTVTVFFTTTAATVLDYATTKVKVPAGGDAKWTAAASFAAEPNMRCVLRGVG